MRHFRSFCHLTILKICNTDETVKARYMEILETIKRGRMVVLNFQYIADEAPKMNHSGQNGAPARSRRMNHSGQNETFSGGTLLNNRAFTVK